MAEVTLPSQTTPAEKLTEESESTGTKIEIDEDSTGTNNKSREKDENEKEEEAALDNDFIKVEKESMESVASGIQDQRSSDSKEKVRELEIELQKMSNLLKETESVKKHLEDELSGTKQRLEDLEQVKKEKQELEDAAINLRHHAIQMKELTDGLEVKLQRSDENCRKADSLLSEAVANTKELEQKLRTLEDHHIEIGNNFSTANQKNLELSQAAEEAKLHLQESETLRIAAEQRNVELEQKLNLEGSKTQGYHRDLEELSEKLSQLSGEIKDKDGENQELGSKLRGLEAEFSKSKDRCSDLETELEAIQLKASTLEVALQASHEKEKELTETINGKTEENKKLREESEISNDKLSQAESLLGSLHDELNGSRQRLESIKSDLEATGLRESDVLEKLKLAEEKLEQQSHVLEKVIARSAELESSHETLTRESELKIQEAVANYTTRDSEAIFLHDKVVGLEDEVRSYQLQLGEATEKFETTSKDLAHILLKLQSSEGVIEELSGKLSDRQHKESAASVGSVPEGETFQSSDLQKKLDSLKEVEEHEAASKKLSEEIESKKEELVLLNSHLKKQAEEVRSKEKEGRVKSGETELVPTSSSSQVSSLNVKFIVGVAIVSIVIGIVLGKKLLV
ncbi:hypothetical protein M569_12164 [Genlisea aurea]|uniref:Uncharacterized protein n=1 Tax=Genlisea aurea TaxID=192259 RepID=S8DS37_9LAMI|nr:hypothetical protein M569_12164 [Genlisea aurea]